jgi:hypothetical protein
LMKAHKARKARKARKGLFHLAEICYIKVEC